MTESRSFGSSFTNFELVNQLKNQIRIKAPCLYQDPERAYILEILLRNREAILTAQAVPEMASVAIQFDPEKLPKKNLLILLDAVLTNIGNKSRDKIHEMSSCAVDISVPETKLNFAVNGMSCPSCALFLEMILKRDACVSHACVDFASGTATVQGRLTQEEIIAIAKSHGFEAVIINETTQHKLVRESSQGGSFFQEEPVLSIWL